jgi:lipopolysaccharide export system protein LptA
MNQRPLWLLIPTALAVAPALAAEPAASTPVHLRAERIEIDTKRGVSRYQGRVVLTQGTLRVTADRAEARGRQQTVEQVTAEGRPTTFRYRAAGRPELIEGEARHAEYDTVKRQLELSGAVEVREGRNLLRAGTVHYDLQAETVTAHADREQRVYAALARHPQADTEPETGP